MRVLFLLIICTVLIETKLVIKDANIAAISRDDIGMIFYVEIHNTDNCRYHVGVRMVKCVEEVDVSDKDCEVMQLIGGDMGHLKPRCSKNLTLLYPNMYLHNRKGYCVIAIRFQTDTREILEKKTNVSFNTIISNTQPVPYHLKGYYTKKEVTTCRSVDLDPLRHCQPVDCHAKYVGTRSYFNHHWSRCQKVPKCIYDVDKKLPDVGYSPITNRCLDLEKCIAKSDIAPLENKFDEVTRESSKFGALVTTLNCHFGKMNNETGVCDCLPGWDSEPFDVEPTLFVYHMCNIERIAAVAVAMTVIILSFILYHLYKCLKSFETSRKKSHEDESDLETAKDKKLICVCPSPEDSKSSVESKTSKTSKASKTSFPKKPSKSSRETAEDVKTVTNQSSLVFPTEKKKKDPIPPAEPVMWKLGTFGEPLDCDKASWKLGTFGEVSKKFKPKRAKSPDWTFDAPKEKEAEHPWKLGPTPRCKERKPSESSIKSKQSIKTKSNVTFCHSDCVI